MAAHHFFLGRSRILLLTGDESNSMRFGGGVTRALGVSEVALASLFAPISEAAAFLKGFSAACMFTPVLQPKLEYNFWAGALHFGQVTALSDSLKRSLSSNSELHLVQAYS